MDITFAATVSAPMHTGLIIKWTTRSTTRVTRHTSSYPTAVETFEKLPTNMRRYVFGHIMTQMTVSAGIAKHGEAVVNALLQEFCQLNDKKVFKPIDASTLSKDE